MPYNRDLLLRYHAYINIEWCNQSILIKYLFKYINKGYDRVIALIVNDSEKNIPTNENRDEIKKIF